MSLDYSTGLRSTTSPSSVPPESLTDADVRRVQAHWLFRDVPGELLGALVGAAHKRSLLAGEQLFAEGDPPDGVYIVAAGAVRIEVAGEGGGALLSTLTVDAVFGEMGVLDGAPRSGTATAIGPATLYFFPAEPFRQLLQRTSVVSLRLLTTLAARLRQTNARVAELPVLALHAGTGLRP